MKAGDTDLHDWIKTFGLEYDVPTQLIRPGSLRFRKNDDGQEKAEVAWNLAVAMLYKSKGGILGNWGTWRAIPAMPESRFTRNVTETGVEPMLHWLKCFLELERELCPSRRSRGQG